MRTTAIRAFSRTVSRRAADVQAGEVKTGTAAQWFGYFAGVTGLIGVGAGILYKMNTTEKLEAIFNKHGNLNKETPKQIH